VAEECLYSLQAPIRRAASHDVPLPVAPVMEQTVVPSQARIKAAIQRCCEG
jgi:pyruvate dehydrogenase E1 component beta subunit